MRVYMERTKEYNIILTFVCNRSKWRTTIIKGKNVLKPNNFFIAFNILPHGFLCCYFFFVFFVFFSATEQPAILLMLFFYECVTSSWSFLLFLVVLHFFYNQIIITHNSRPIIFLLRLRFTGWKHMVLGYIHFFPIFSYTFVLLAINMICVRFVWFIVFFILVLNGMFFWWLHTNQLNSDA